VGPDGGNGFTGINAVLGGNQSAITPTATNCGTSKSSNNNAWNNTDAATYLISAKFTTTTTPWSFFYSSGVACFVSGTRILSQNGYKPIEEFTDTDLLVTSDNRLIDFKLHHTLIAKTDEKNAPYVILPHAFGHNKPLAPLYLSPTHKFEIRKGVWMSPQMASRTNPLVKRTTIGGPVSYFHIECENFLQDNIIAEGMVTESYGIALARKLKYAIEVYTWSHKLGGYTRASPAALNGRTRVFTISS